MLLGLLLMIGQPLECTIIGWPLGRKLWRGKTVVFWGFFLGRNMIIHMNTYMCITKQLSLFLVSLVEAVYLEYARLLANLGLRAPAEYYCQRAGSKGNQFREEVRILFSWRTNIIIVVSSKTDRESREMWNCTISIIVWWNGRT